jgi:division protein CdvB (Snf7/Vps24/ESCRT-III family)
MTNVAQQFLRSFKALPTTDQHDVLVQLLRLPIEATYAAASDEELVQVADEVFLELDKSERAG